MRSKSRSEQLYEDKILNRLDDGDLDRVVRDHPHLARVVELNLLAAGGLASRGARLAQHIEEAEIAALSKAIDGATYVAKSPPTIARGLLGGACNLAEDIMFGAINAIGPYDKLKTYRECLRPTTSHRRFRRR